MRENRYYSEDWTFCENWRDLGGQVWVDKRVLLRHTGTYVFDGPAQDKLYADLHAIVEANRAAQAPQTPPAITAPIDMDMQHSIPVEALGEPEATVLAESEPSA